MGNVNTERRKRQKESRRARELANEENQISRSWRDALTAVRNRSDGNCGAWSVFLHALRDGGMEAREAQVVLSLDGATSEAKKAMTDFILLCRKRIVQYAACTGETFYPSAGPTRTDEEIDESLRSAGQIRSHSEWELVVRKLYSYLDDEAVCILRKIFGLPDTQVVQEDITGQCLVDVNANQLPCTGLLRDNLVLHRGHHFEAVVPKV